MKAKLYDRLLAKRLVDPRSANKIRLVFGARQTGKTVLMDQLFAGSKARVFNLQDTRLRQRFERNPASFRQELMALDRDTEFVGVDEVQKAPALLEELQLAYDRFPDRWQILLTGSSARRLRSQSSNLLPGRCHLFHLYPVVRCEEEGFEGKLGSPRLKADRPFPARSLEARLVYGSLPGIRAEAPETAAATLEAYVENYLEEEIRREALVRDVGAFLSFLVIAAVASGQQTNLAKLSQESGVPASTLRNYYQILEDTFAGYAMRCYSRAGRKRVLSTPRFFFFDLGVRNAAARLPWQGVLSPESAGRLLEHWVGLELIHRAGYAGRTHAVSFWRTVSGAEVDFIWETPDEDVPIEVKWTGNPGRRDGRHLETFLDLYPRRSKRGLLVCRVEQSLQLSERVTAIPWHRL